MTPSRLAEWAKRVTDIVLTAPGYEQAPALVAREIRRLMHEFDEQIEAGDEPLDYWLDAPTTPLPGAGTEPGPCRQVGCETPWLSGHVHTPSSGIEALPTPTRSGVTEDAKESAVTRLTPGGPPHPYGSYRDPTPAREVCAEWCGSRWKDVPLDKREWNPQWYWSATTPPHPLYTCSAACRDAGHPLHPPETGGKTPR